MLPEISPISIVTGHVNRKRSALLAFLTAFCLAACVSFVGPYDPTIDQLITDLTVRTETTVAAADAGQLSTADRDAFYNGALGTTRTLSIRAKLIPKNEDEAKALGDLEQRLLALQSRHLSPRTSLTTALRATLLDIQQIEVAKKRSTVVRNSSNP
jgi:hypothetical protein